METRSSLREWQTSATMANTGNSDCRRDDVSIIFPRAQLGGLCRTRVVVNSLLSQMRFVRYRRKTLLQPIHFNANVVDFGCM
jgi:hypothetical protein